MTYFMEQSIATADKVLVILTPNYKNKAEKRENGVGYETSIISQSILSSPISKIKFVPILRKGNISTASPMHLASKLYHDMRDDTKYYDCLFELARLVYDKIAVNKPDLGPIPDFDNPLVNDYLIDTVNYLISQDELNKKLDTIIRSHKGAQLSLIEKDKIVELIQEKEKLYSENTKLTITVNYNDRNMIIINCMGFSAVINLDFATNTAQFTFVNVKYYKGYLNSNSSGMYLPGREPKFLSAVEYKLDLDKDEKIVWKTEAEVLNTDKLVNKIMSQIIGNLSQERSKNFR